MGTFGITDWKIDLSQNSGVVPPMWNSELKPINLSKEQILANALNDYRANLPKVIEKYKITKDIELTAWNGKEGFSFNQSNEPKIKFKKGDIVDGFIMPNQFQSEPPSYLIITDKTKSDAMFRFANGGRGFKGYDFIEKIQENQQVVNETVNLSPVVNLSPEEKFYQSLGLKSSMFSPLKSKGRLLIAVVLVGGYFAYKKFKK
jgi:hypothetical protein